jgi:hypothetical protein
MEKEPHSEAALFPFFFVLLLNRFEMFLSAYRSNLKQFQDNYRMGEKMKMNSVHRCRSKHVFAVFLTLAIVFVTVTGLQKFSSVQADTVPLSISLPSMNLTLVASNGTEVVLHSTDIAGLPSYRAFGGYKNVLGNIRGLGNYTGVPFTTLCDLVGGINNGDILRVSASDYAINFTYDQVKNGDFITFDPATGDEVSHLQPLTPIIAYYKNDTNISSTDGGPLRLAIVGSEGLVTNSTLWVKWVVKLEIITAGVPEFPSHMTMILLMVITLFAAVIYRKSLSAKSIVAEIARRKQ